MNYVQINQRELKRLKKLYNRAVEKHKKCFHFQGYALLTAFAKYYIEYIEMVVLRGTK